MSRPGGSLDGEEASWEGGPTDFIVVEGSREVLIGRNNGL